MALSGLFIFSTKPLRFCIFLGVVVAAACFIFGSFVFLQAIWGLATPPTGIFSLLLSVLFLFGLQLIFLGVMGEYVLQIHANTIGGKHVYENKVLNFDAEE